MFSDSVAGAEASALIFSIINTAKANNLDAYKYLEYILRNLPNSNFIQDSSVLKEYLPWANTVQLGCRINTRRNLELSLPNIDFMVNMTKEFRSGKIDDIAYTLDFPYELEQRRKKMHREDDDYCKLIYECLYEEDVAMYNELLDPDLKKLI